MLKIMIADDERIIREGLTEAINWSELGLKLIGTAGNGEDALILAEATKPDICLVDIMMPLLNGLEFIERLQQINSDVQFIIITGYDEFEYAQRAIKLKIFDYLLKPIDEEELEKVLKNAIDKIKKMNTTTRRINLMEDQLEKTMPETRKNFVLDCLNGKCTIRDTEKFERLFGIKFSENIGLILMRFADCVYLGEERNRPDYATFVKRLKGRIMEEVERECSLLMISEAEMDGGLVLVAEENGVDFRELCNDIEKSIEQELDYRTCIFCEVVSSGIHTIDQAFSSIMRSINTGEKFIPVVRMAKKYIDNHFMEEDITLSKIAAEFNVSTGHVSRLFKKELGISYSDYLESKRISKAIALLEEDSKKIYEIAEMVGYGSQHYFCTAFKKAVGVSPSEYKRRNE